MTRVRWFAILLLPFAAAACRIDEEVTLYPDGSGKYTISIGVAKKEGETDARWPNLGAFPKQCDGFVAWTEPERHEDEKWRIESITGYFEDVNRLRFWKTKYAADVPAGERETGITYERVEKDGETRLTIRFADPEPFKISELGRREMGESRYTRKVTVPGGVVEATGATFRKERTVGVRVDNELIQGVINGKDEAIEALEAANAPMVIRWKGSSLTDAEIRAFKKEMAAAREKWKARSER